MSGKIMYLQEDYATVPKGAAVKLVEANTDNRLAESVVVGDKSKKTYCNVIGTNVQLVLPADNDVLDDIHPALKRGPFILPENFDVRVSYGTGPITDDGISLSWKRDGMTLSIIADINSILVPYYCQDAGVPFTRHSYSQLFLDGTIQIDGELYDSTQRVVALFKDVKSVVYVPLSTGQVMDRIQTHLDKFVREYAPKMTRDGFDYV